MSVLTQIIAADDEDIEAIGESLHPCDEWSGIERRDIDTARIATLHALLTGELFDESVARYEPVYVSASEGALVLRMADELAARLAALDEDVLDDVASELSASEAFEDADADVDDIVELLAELGELARRAEAEQQSLFIWMHPLRT